MAVCHFGNFHEDRIARDSLWHELTSPHYFEEFKSIIATKTGDASKITMDSNLKELGLDSLDLVEIILDGEEKCGITFENEELLTFKTVGDVVRSAESKK